jgi:Methyltransferase domain
MPFTFIAGSWFWWLRNQKIENFPLTRKLFRKIGVFPIINHYYEPLFDPQYLHRNTSIPRELSIYWNDELQLKILENFNYQDELLKIPLDKTEGYYYKNESFGIGDAEYWYSMIRHFSPNKIIEVGCGFSTYLTQLALSKNKELNSSFSCKHICIEPYERDWLNKMDVELYRERLELVDLDLFKNLDAGDLIFIDSSHTIRPQGDVVTFILSILPTLKSGVIVHFHDIFSPRDYPYEWIIDSVRIFGEQYLLEAFMTCNEEWEILGALNYLKYTHFENLKTACPMLTLNSEPGSFYIRKK